MSGDVEEIRGLVYSGDGTLHMIPPDTAEWTDDGLVERQSAVCGGGFPADILLHETNGITLTDELRKDSLCEECLEGILGEDVTVPGFVVDGEFVGEAKRLTGDGWRV